METIKQIIYRNSDDVLLPCPNSDKQIIPYIVSDLPTDSKSKCEALKTFCLAQIEDSETLVYVVYIESEYMMYIEVNDQKTYKINTAELTGAEKDMVNAVGLVCTQLINA